VPLPEIRHLLDLQGRDRAAVLGEHREWLDRRIKRSRQLLRTIDRTIAELNGDGTMKDQDFYEGFGPEKQAEYEDWLVERYGGDMRQRIESSKARVSTMGKGWMAAQKEVAEAVFADLTEAFKAGTASVDPANDPVLERHRACIAAMWGRPCPPRAYAGVADLYLAHPDFRKNMDQRGPGFTDWLSAAMKSYAARFA
jgi:hypothetical protein